jgi:hypothetical protein
MPHRAHTGRTRFAKSSIFSESYLLPLFLRAASSRAQSALDPAEGIGPESLRLDLEGFLGSLASSLNEMC